jgi:hypothetical protein
MQVTSMSLASVGGTGTGTVSKKLNSHANSMSKLEKNKA